MYVVHGAIIFLLLSIPFLPCLFGVNLLPNFLPCYNINVTVAQVVPHIMSGSRELYQKYMGVQQLSVAVVTFW